MLADLRTARDNTIDNSLTGPFFVQARHAAVPSSVIRNNIIVGLEQWGTVTHPGGGSGIQVSVFAFTAAVEVYENIISPTVAGVWMHPDNTGTTRRYNNWDFDTGARITSPAEINPP
jgi:hypothetical protein